jgi:hypothetical protein
MIRPMKERETPASRAARGRTGKAIPPPTPERRTPGTMEKPGRPESWLLKNLNTWSFRRVFSRWDAAG